MQFFRFIKPVWGRKYLKDTEPNPDFKKEIMGPNVIEGALSEEEVESLNESGYNVYWFPNKPSKDIYKDGAHFLSGRMIDTFEYVFVDMDLKDGEYNSVEEFLKEIEDFEVSPSLTVKSGNGCHVYWKIKDLDRESYILLQKGLINKFRTDSSVWTVLQLMRLPGSLNTKDFQNFKKTETVDSLSTGNVYQVSDFSEVFNYVREEDVAKAKRHMDKLDGKLEISLPQEVNTEELPESFIDFIQNPENSACYNLFTNPAEFYKDRSAADMKLINILYNHDFSKNDALAVAANTQKALEKGYNRLDYAQITVDKAYVDRTKNKFRSVKETIGIGGPKISGQQVKGPSYFDYQVLGNPWRKKQVMGLIGGTGVGKTEVTLKMFREMIQNNSDNDDIYVFFSLEMPELEIVERWVKAVGEESPLADRLYVIANEDDKGEPRNIGLQEIYEYCLDLKKYTGKEIASVAVDHIGILSKHIDTRKKETFGIQNEEIPGFGDVRTISLANAATQFKVLAKRLDTFMVILTQTTKAKGVGDLPIAKDGAYGISNYENIMDYIITIWQPLMRVHHMTNLRVLGWQYAKIRNKHKEDRIQTYEPKLLTYLAETGDLRPTTQEEFSRFHELLEKANELRKQEDGKNCSNYSRTLSAEELNDIDKKLRNLKVVK